MVSSWRIDDFKTFLFCRGSWHGLCYLLVGEAWTTRLINSLKWAANTHEACLEFAEKILSYRNDLIGQLVALFCVGMAVGESGAAHLEKKMFACELQAYFTVGWTQYRGAAGIVFVLDYIEPLAWLGLHGKAYIPRALGCWYWHPFSSGFIV